ALNPVFIFGLGPIPRLGIAGSALATFVAQAVSLFALIRHLYRRRHILCLHRDELPLLKPDWSVVATLVRKGLPMSAQMLVLSLSGVLMITLVNRFGVDTTAAFGAALQIWNYIQMPAFAVAMGLFGVVRAAGAVIAPLVILSIALLAVRFPLAELLLERYRADAIWWSFPVSSALAATLALLYYRHGSWRHAHMMSAVKP